MRPQRGEIREQGGSGIERTASCPDEIDAHGLGKARRTLCTLSTQKTRDPQPERAGRGRRPHAKGRPRSPFVEAWRPIANLAPRTHERLGATVCAMYSLALSCTAPYANPIDRQPQPSFRSATRLLSQHSAFSLPIYSTGVSARLGYAMLRKTALVYQRTQHHRVATQKHFRDKAVLLLLVALRTFTGFLFLLFGCCQTGHVPPLSTSPSRSPVPYSSDGRTP